jgi:diguanylate cyclase (GGDEF)-like protein
MKFADAKSISRLIVLIPVFSVLITSFLISVGLMITFKHYSHEECLRIKTDFYKNLRIVTKERVNAVYEVIKTINQSGKFSKNEMYEIIRKMLSKLHWQDNGYIFVFDSKGNTIYHVEKSYIGTNRWNVVRKGEKIVQIIIKNALKHPDGTYVKYYAYFPGNKSMEKISYIKYYKPLDIVIGSGVYLKYLKEALEQRQKTQKHIIDSLIRDITLYTLLSTLFTLVLMGIIAFILRKMFLDYEEKLSQERKILHFKANYDYLTELCNRECFYRKLNELVNSSNESFALIFLDLDYFKQINDMQGHKVGDQVLKIIGNRLKNFEENFDLITRIGGDEFVMVKKYKNKAEIEKLCKKILDVLKEEISVDNKKFYVSGSMGISLYPEDSDDLEKLIIYSDIAMYHCKKEKRDSFCFYSSKYEFDKNYNQFKKEMLDAIENGEIKVYFQPQFDVSKKLYGSETLVRWNSEKEGVIPPCEFIPLAIEVGIIDKIDLYVFEEAVKTYKKWYDKGYNPGVLSWNVTMIQLQQEDFVQKVKNIIKKYNYDTSFLNLEITEESIMKHPKASIKTLTRLKELGIKVSIDDFGTGYSSLSYLKKLPIDKIKIDQSFIEDIPQDNDDVVITKTIISLGKSLNLKLVAEGIRNNIQFQFLKEEGCDYFQGEYFSMPVSIEEFEEKFLKENNGSK